MCDRHHKCSSDKQRTCRRNPRVPLPHGPRRHTLTPRASDHTASRLLFPRHEADRLGGIPLCHAACGSPGETCFFCSRGRDARGDGSSCSQPAVWWRQACLHAASSDGSEADSPVTQPHGTTATANASAGAVTPGTATATAATATAAAATGTSNACQHDSRKTSAEHAATS